MHNGVAEQVRAELVSGNYFAELQVSPVLGRPVLPLDDQVQKGAPLVAMLGYSYWQRRFAASKDVIGQTVTMDGTPATIIGVAPFGLYRC